MSFGGAVVFARHFLFPLCVLASGALAYADHQLALAALLVSLPTLFTWATFVIFAVAMFSNGF